MFLCGLGQARRRGCLRARLFFSGARIQVQTSLVEGNDEECAVLKIFFRKEEGWWSCLQTAAVSSYYGNSKRSSQFFFWGRGGRGTVTSPSLKGDCDALHHDRLQRPVVRIGCNLGNPCHNVHPLNNLAKHGVLRGSAFIPPV